MSQDASGSCTNGRWTENRERAAERVATGLMTDAEIAQEAGVSARSLYTWKATDQFKARVAYHLQVQAEAVQAQGIANRQNRVNAQNERWLKMQQVILLRSQDTRYPQEPGYSTGLLVHNVKGVGHGKSFHLVELFEVDTGLLREMRELEKHSATELGQWEEKRAHSGVIGLQPIVEVEVGLTKAPESQ